MLTNEHLKDSLRDLARIAAAAEGTLKRGDDLPPEDLAETMVALGKLREKTAKLADRISKLAAPLFGSRGSAAAEPAPVQAGSDTTSTSKRKGKAS